MSMATARWTSLHPTVITGAASALALLLVLVLSPSASDVQAANVFASLRQPGEAGFVASHRGDKEGAPENTLPAFELAIASDAEFVETDLQLTADGVPVLMHDWTIDRTTNGSGPVWAHTWAELSELDAGSWYSAEFADTRIPTLTDLLELVRPSGKRALLELKGSWNAEQLQAVAEQIHDNHLEQRVVFASFDIMSLRALEQVAADLPRMIITREVVGDPAILAATCGAVAIVTSQAFVEGDPGAVDRIHAAGLGVLLYTLNNEETWSEAISLGVDGIITDKPALFGDWLSGTPDVFAAPVESAAG